MTPTPRTGQAESEGLIRGCATPAKVVRADFARQLERENAELLESLEILSTHGHSDDCLMLNRANALCDCGLDFALAAIAKAKGKP
jgi:hypothetical protein